MSFRAIQAAYAAHGVATYPLSASKTPAVRAYDRIGAPYSALLAIRFPDAPAGGFVAGGKNKIAVADIDSPDERLRDEIVACYGDTPLQVLTPSGGRHLYYRHGGELRRIRPLPDVDILGGGNVVAVGSATPKGTYVIERGSLDDLDRLPRMKAAPASPPKPGTVPVGQRGNALFAYCCSIVDTCDTLDQLTDGARTWVEQRCEQPASDPVNDAEIIKTCASVWRFRGGRRPFMQHVIEGPEFAKLTADLEVWGICSYLLATNGPAAEFMIADGLAGARGWPRRAVPRARRVLVDRGIVKCIRQPRKGSPGLYRWSRPNDE